MKKEPWENNRCRKSLFLSICQIAKIPNKIAKTLYDQNDKVGKEYENLIECLKKNERYNSRLNYIKFIHSELVTGLLKGAGSWLETHNTAAEQKSINRLYLSYFAEVQELNDPYQLYVFLDHRSPKVCALFGCKDDVERKIDLLGGCNFSYIKMRTSLPMDGETFMIALIPTTVLFLEDFE